MNNKLFLLLLLVVSLNIDGYSQWNVDPSINTSVCLSVNDQQDVRIVSDSKGGAILTWVDFRNDPTLADIFIQRINSKGIVIWTSNGVAICTNTSDQGAVSLTESGNGSAILVWVDSRNGNRDIYAQKIDSSGVIQWTSDGAPVCLKTENQRNPRVLNDSSGGAFVVWEDSINGSWDVYAQRLGSIGNRLWNPSGVIICGAPYSQINPRMETDGSGGAIIVWQDKRNNVDYDIYSQRVDSSGTIKWNVNGVVIASNVGTQSNPKLEPDHANGVIIAWQDKRNGNDYDVYAQRINSSGTIQWTTNGVAVCSMSGSQSAIDMTSENINGAIIAWKDNRNGNYDIYYQMINLSGNLQFTSGGNAMTVLSNDQLNPSIIGDGYGGAIIVWQDSSAGTWDIYSGKINSAGGILWKLPVGTAGGNQINPKNVSDGSGGVIFAWQDKRNTINKYDIYTHRIFSDGVTESVYEKDQKNIQPIVFPNPFSLNTTIKIENPKNNYLDFTIKVFDISGREIGVQVVRKPDGFVIFRGNLDNGIYIYKISELDHVSSNGYFIITQ